MNLKEKRWPVIIALIFVLVVVAFLFGTVFGYFLGYVVTSANFCSHVNSDTYIEHDETRKSVCNWK